MKKAELLRAHLVASVPHLKKEPANLHVFIEKGAIGCRLGGGLSFDYRYEINLAVLDFTDHADTLMIPLLAWIAVNEPALMQSPDTLEQVLRFEAEILDNEKADISITVPVSERVIVTQDPATKIYTATHADEPPLDDITGPNPWQLYLNSIAVVTYE
ncbi:MAG: phage tail protein [Georgfuchsia sp.]